MAYVSGLLNRVAASNKTNIVSAASNVKNQLNSKSFLLNFDSKTSLNISRWKSSSSVGVLNEILNKVHNQSESNTRRDENNENLNAVHTSSTNSSTKSSLRKELIKNYLISLQKNNNNTNTNNTSKRNMSSSATAQPRLIQVENINPNFVTMEYAVRGPILLRAAEIEMEIKKGKKYPFDQVIRANIGDAHAMGQTPITFLRQVLSLVVNPHLLESADFPTDAKQRAKDILTSCSGHSFGAYTDSYGIELIRHQVADFIKRRDGIDCDWNNIILTAGATAGIKSLLSLLNCQVDCKKPGIMIPIPQYPLYSATIAEYGMTPVNYFLNESKNWALDTNELERSYQEGSKYTTVRALCIINPGNPTGQVLTCENIVEIIKFAQSHKLMIFADEVYQDNVYDPNSKFHSFKRVMIEMGKPYCDMELASFMSTSKGYLGECGIRGGYAEILNLCPKVKAMLLKSISASLCPTTAGQVACSVLVNPPREGEPSFEKFMSEKKAVLGALKERAELIHKAFSSFEGFNCNPIQGAMYAFPEIKIPPKAIEEAKKQGKAPDVFYAFQLLEEKGICIVPGSGFGQYPGTYHFRTTILPQTDKLKIMLEKMREFHTAFMKKYA